jgi:hypothetical protein
MRKPSYSEALTYWDAVARVRAEQLDRQQGKTPKQWEQEWKQNFGENVVAVTHNLRHSAGLASDYRVKQADGQSNGAAARVGRAGECRNL